jgi:hypothetical protein
VPLFLLLGGCSTTLKPTAVGETGYFDTNTKLIYDGIIIEKAFKPEYKKMIYVKTDEDNEKFKMFYLETFKNMNEFDSVFSKEELETLVFDRDLTGKVSSVSDKIGLHNLQKEIGSFLVVEPYADWKGGYDYIANLKVYDPETGKDVLVLENTAFNWAGLDKPLFYPLFNAFLEWSRGENIQTEPTSAE